MNTHAQGTGEVVQIIQWNNQGQKTLFSNISENWSLTPVFQLKMAADGKAKLSIDAPSEVIIQRKELND